MNSNKIYDLSKIPGCTNSPEQFWCIIDCALQCTLWGKVTENGKVHLIVHVLMLTYKFSDFFFREIKEKETYQRSNMQKKNVDSQLLS